MLLDIVNSCSILISKVHFVYLPILEKLDFRSYFLPPKLSLLFLFMQIYRIALLCLRRWQLNSSGTTICHRGCQVRVLSTSLQYPF